LPLWHLLPFSSPQIRTIRRKMVEIMAREASSCDLKDLVAKFIPEAIGKDIEKACQVRV
jgi:small subunit ribosomal protein S3Ae